MIQLKNCRETVQLVDKNNLIKRAQSSGLLPVQLRLDLDEYNIYRTMMDKFLNQGGEIRTASVEIDLEEERYTVCLIGVNGNKFLFTTRRMMGMDELKAQIKGSKKFVLVSRYRHPFNYSSAYELTPIPDGGYDMTIVGNDNGHMQCPVIYWPWDTVTMSKYYRDEKEGRQRRHLSLFTQTYGGFPERFDGRMKDTVTRHLNNVRARPERYQRRGTHDVKEKIEYCPLPTLQYSKHSFLVGEGCFSVPLVGAVGVHNVQFKALRITSLESTEFNISIDKSHFQEDSVFLLLDDFTLLSELYEEIDNVEDKELCREVLDECQDFHFPRVPSRVTLDWVAPKVNKRKPPESYLDMMGVVHMITQPTGTTKEWFAKSNKYHPRGDLRLVFDEDSVTYTIVNDGKVAVETRIDTPRVMITRNGVEKTTQINYYDFKEIVIKTSGGYAEALPSIEEAGLLATTESIGMDSDGRMIYGVIGATGDQPECYITLNPLATEYPDPEDIIKSESLKSSSIEDNTYYIKWRNFAEEYCHARRITFSPDVRFCFNRYLNSGELTQDDVDELKRLTQD